MKLPKGMPLPALSNGFTIFDLDEDGAAEKIDELPEWIQNRIKESETWKAMTEAAEEREAIQNEEYPDGTPTPALTEDVGLRDGELPF